MGAFFQGISRSFMNAAIGRFISANADARVLPFMIMQRVCGNVDGASRFRPAIFRRAAHMALEEFTTVTNVGRPLAAALVPSDYSVPIALRGKSSRRSR